MPDNKFAQALLSEVSNESSSLRSSLANTILRVKDANRATDKALQALASFAKENGAEKATIDELESATSDIFSTVSNAIFYNANSVTINPAIPNSPSKSPKGIADKVIQEVAKALGQD
jgi:hypothetical protein